MFRKYKRFYSLSKKHVASEKPGSVAQKIENLSAQNTHWIAIITQTIVFMGLILLVSKILLDSIKAFCEPKSHNLTGKALI